MTNHENPKATNDSEVFIPMIVDMDSADEHGMLLSGKLNDALSGRLFYADFGSHGGNSHFKNGCFCELFS